MFFEKPLLNDINIRDYRNETMQIISGAYCKQRLHYKALCDNQACVSNEMKAFLLWINTIQNFSAYIKAAMAKFWFVTIYLFDDGNGRLSRIIAERVLVNNESNLVRVYSISHQIAKNRHEYYDLLEKMQKYKDNS